MGVVLGTSYIITPRQVWDLRLIPGCIATLPFFLIVIMTKQNPHPGYKYTKGMSYKEFLVANPHANASLHWDENVSEAIDIYYDLKEYYND